MFGVSLIKKYYYSWGSDSWQIRGTVLALSRSEFLHSDCGLPAGLRLLPDHGGHHQGEEFIQLAPGGELFPLFRTFWWQPQAEFSTWSLAGRHLVSTPPWWESHSAMWGSEWQQTIAEFQPLLPQVCRHRSGLSHHPHWSPHARKDLSQNIIFQVSVAVHTLADLCNLCQVAEVFRVSTGIPLYNKQRAIKPTEQQDTKK